MRRSILCLVIAAPALAGCGSSTPQPKPTTPIKLAETETQPPSGAKTRPSGAVAVHPRGLRPLPTVSFTANLFGGKGEAPGGSGAVSITLLNRNNICWRFSLLSNVAHPTSTGLYLSGIESGIPLSSGGYDRAGCLFLGNSALLKELREHPERFYVKVNSTAHPKGAVRGQL